MLARSKASALESKQKFLTQKYRQLLLDENGLSIIQYSKIKDGTKKNIVGGGIGRKPRGRPYMRWSDNI